MINTVAWAGVSDFDAGLFRISSAEASAMDAQQRLLLEAALEVIGAANPSGSKGKVGKPSLPSTIIRLVLLCRTPMPCAPVTSSPYMHSFQANRLGRLL